MLFSLFSLMYQTIVLHLFLCIYCYPIFYLNLHAIFFSFLSFLRCLFNFLWFYQFTHRATLFSLFTSLIGPSVSFCSALSLIFSYFFFVLPCHFFPSFLQSIRFYLKQNATNCKHSKTNK